MDSHALDSDGVYRILETGIRAYFKVRIQEHSVVYRWGFQNAAAEDERFIRRFREGGLTTHTCCAVPTGVRCYCH